MMRRIPSFTIPILFLLLVPIMAYASSDAVVPISPSTVGDVARLAELRLPPPQEGYPKPFYWQVAFSPDGKQLAAATSSGSVIAFDPYSNAIQWQAQVDQGMYPITQLTYDLSGTYLLVAGDYAFNILKTDMGTIVSSNRLELKSDFQNYQRPKMAAFSPDSKLVYLMTGMSNLYRVFDVASGREVDRIAPRLGCDFHAFLAGNTQVLCAFSSLSFLRSSVDLEPIRELTGTLPMVDYLSTSADGSLLLIAGRTQGSNWENYDFTLHDAVTFTELKRVSRAAFADDWPMMIPNNDGSLLIGVISGVVKVLDMQTGDFSVSFPIPDRLDSIGRSIAFSPREDRFARILTTSTGAIEIYGVADCWATTSHEVNRRAEPTTESPVAGPFIATDRVAIVASQTVNGILWRQLEDQTWVRTDVIDLHGQRCS